MNVQLTMSVNLTLPDGSASMDMTGGRGWVLPNGDVVKPWATLEWNDERDLTRDETLELGCDIVDMVTSVEIADEGF
jgi:hypothetical protein